MSTPTTSPASLSTPATRVATRNPARSTTGSTTGPTPARPGRTWAVAGIVAGVAGLALTTLSGRVDAVYTEGAAADPRRIITDLASSTPVLLAFHVAATLAVLALAVFGVGLHRSLRRALGEDSLLPGLAAFGVLATCVVVLMGTALDTEFIFGVKEPGLTVPEVGAFYNHWIGTVPWVWGLTGLTGLSLFGASRVRTAHGRRAVAGWLGIVGLVLGVLSLLVTLGPLQYLAGLTGSVLVLLAGVGCTLARAGD